MAFVSIKIGTLHFWYIHTSCVQVYILALYVIPKRTSDTEKLVLNSTKTNVIKFTPKTTVHVPLGISYKNYVLNEVNSTKFLGIHIDRHMNWKNHIEQISHKLSVACFTIRNLTHTLNADILRMVYFAYFQPVFQYGIIFWGNSAHAQQIFKLQKRVITVFFDR